MLFNSPWRRGGLLWLIYSLIFTAGFLLTFFLVLEEREDAVFAFLCSVVFLYPIWVLWTFSILYLFNFVDLGVQLISKNKKTGKIPLGRRIIFSPFIILSFIIWRVKQLLSSENPYDEVSPGIFVGKYPYFYPAKFPEECGIVVDLTTEFSAVQKAISGRKYYCFPSLDFVLSDEVADLAAIAASLVDAKEPMYIHCANGHGRSATLAAIVLVLNGTCEDLDKATEIMQSKRPRIRFNYYQRHIATSVLRFSGHDEFARVTL